MHDFWDLYRPLATLGSPEWPHLMGRVLRFHDAVYMNHRSTFRSFPLKEQPDDPAANESSYGWWPVTAA